MEKAPLLEQPAAAKAPTPSLLRPSREILNVVVLGLAFLLMMAAFQTSSFFQVWNGIVCLSLIDKCAFSGYSAASGLGLSMVFGLFFIDLTRTAPLGRNIEGSRLRRSGIDNVSSINSFTPYNCNAEPQLDAHSTLESLLRLALYVVCGISMNEWTIEAQDSKSSLLHNRTVDLVLLYFCYTSHHLCVAFNAQSFVQT